MTHAERTGAKARDVAARLERLARALRAMEYFQPVAERIGEGDHIPHAPLVGERARAARHHDAVALEPGRKAIESSCVSNLPAEKADAFTAIFRDDQPLLAVVHAEGEHAAALVHELHAQKLLAKGRPVFQRLGAHTDISESVNRHCCPQSCNGILASFTTLANFARSFLNTAANASGVLATTSLAVASMRSRTSGAFSALAASCWISATISPGVFAGTNQPCQLDESNPGKPLSAMVGTCGSAGERLAPAIASARSLPASTWGLAVANGTTASWTSPAISAVLSGASPR